MAKANNYGQKKRKKGQAVPDWVRAVAVLLLEQKVRVKDIRSWVGAQADYDVSEQSVHRWRREARERGFIPTAQEETLAADVFKAFKADPSAAVWLDDATRLHREFPSLLKEEVQAATILRYIDREVNAPYFSRLAAILIDVWEWRHAHIREQGIAYAPDPHDMVFIDETAGLHASFEWLKQRYGEEALTVAFENWRQKKSALRGDEAGWRFMDGRDH